MDHDKKMYAPVVIFTELVPYVVVCLAGSDVVKRLNIALFEEHRLEVLKSFQDLLTGLVCKPALFNLIQKSLTRKQYRALRIQKIRHC